MFREDHPLEAITRFYLNEMRKDHQARRLVERFHCHSFSIRPDYYLKTMINRCIPSFLALLSLSIVFSSSLSSAETMVPPPVPSARPEASVISGENFTASGKLSLDGSGAMNGEASIVWTNGERYEGSLLSGKKHGHGVFIWANGQRYEGEWLDDRIHGMGRLSYPNGDRYIGSLVNGEPQGRGTYYLQNGDTYVGAWLAGKKHGQGRLTWADGDYWEGEFRDDQQTLNGTLVYGQAETQSVIQEPDAASVVAAKEGVRKKAK